MSSKCLVIIIVIDRLWFGCIALAVNVPVTDLVLLFWQGGNLPPLTKEDQ